MNRRILFRGRLCILLLTAAAVFSTSAGTIEPAAIIPGQNFDLYGSAVATDASWLFIGVPASDNLSGSVQVLSRTSDDFSGWSEIQTLRPTYSAPVRLFGKSLSFQAETGLAVATLHGPVFIFEPNAGAFPLHQAQVIEIPEETDLTTNGLSVSDGFLAVGIIGDGPTDEAGSVKIYERKATGWEFQTKLRASDPEEGAYFGWAVTLIGRYLVVGAPGSADRAGAVYVFERADGTWRQLQKITAPRPQPNLWFGTSVASNIGQIAVGEPGDGDSSDTAGRAYVYDATYENPLRWNFTQELVPSETTQLPLHSQFGLAVAIDGNNRDIVVTQFPPADLVDRQKPGAAYVFTIGVGGWKERLRLAPTEGQEPDAFGVSLAAGSEHVVIGDYGTTRKAGSVYVYDLRLPDLAPVFTSAPNDQMVDSPAGQSVELTFRAVVGDDNGDDLEVKWKVDGNTVETDSIDGGVPITTGEVSLTTTLAPGVHHIEIVAKERDRELETTHGFTITVGDSSLPVIRKVTARPATIVAQGGRFVLVRLTVDASSASGPVRWKITQIESSDPSAIRPHRLPDWLITPNRHSAIVRAQTTSRTANRVYTVHVQVQDRAGKTADGAAAVTVLPQPEKKGRRQ